MSIEAMEIKPVGAESARAAMDAELRVTVKGTVVSACKDLQLLAYTTGNGAPPRTVIIAIERMPGQEAELPAPRCLRWHHCLTWQRCRAGPGRPAGRATVPRVTVRDSLLAGVPRTDPR